MAHPVFASYAQIDRDRDLEKFIVEFRKEILCSLPGIAEAAENVVFFDRDNVQAGDRWSETIVDAVNAADTLLCLMSPTYFTREWCGRELEAFIRRQDRLPGNPRSTSRFIFPIWWRMPVKPRPLPSRLGQYHFKDANFPPAYEKDGLRGLLRYRQPVQFKRMVDRLVELITETITNRQRLPPGETVQDVTQIANAFDEQQPYDVRILVLATGGDHWRPSAVDLSVGEAAATAARRLQIFIRPLETGPSLKKAIEKAQREEQVILAVIDASQPADHPTLALNRLQLPGLAVLLVDAGAPAVGGDVWVQGMDQGAFSAARTAGLMRVSGPGELGPQLELIVDDARRRLMAPSPVARAEDAQLTENALAKGIAVHFQPTLAGPIQERRA